MEERRKVTESGKIAKGQTQKALLCRLSFEGVIDKALEPTDASPTGEIFSPVKEIFKTQHFHYSQAMHSYAPFVPAVNRNSLISAQNLLDPWKMIPSQKAIKKLPSNICLFSSSWKLGRCIVADQKPENLQRIAKGTSGSWRSGTSGCQMWTLNS